MHSNSEIQARIREIICTLLELEQIQDENYALRLIINDSLTAINLVTLIEDEFEIEFDDEDINIDFFNSVSTISSLVSNALSYKP